MDRLPRFKHEDTKKFVLGDNLSKIYANIEETALAQWLATPPSMTYLRVNTTKIGRNALIEKVKCLTNPGRLFIATFWTFLLWKCRNLAFSAIKFAYHLLTKSGHFERRTH